MNFTSETLEISAGRKFAGRSNVSVANAIKLHPMVERSGTYGDVYKIYVRKLRKIADQEKEKRKCLEEAQGHC